MTALRATAVDDLLRSGDLSGAAAAASGRGAALVAAISGYDRELARFLEAGALAGEVTDVSPEAALIASVVASWTGDSSGVYHWLREAHRRALETDRPHLAVAARERFAHHALLFGDAVGARRAIEEAIGLAATHRLANWRRHCIGRACALAADLDDLVWATALFEEVRQGREVPLELDASFAPAAVHVALVTGDDASVRTWTSGAAHEAALNDLREGPAVEAATARLLAIAAPAPIDASLALSVRRALLLVSNPANYAAFLSLVARWSPIEDARYAVDSLRAVFAPQRKYLEAHHWLGRAHLLLRLGERSSAVDSAGDAARAFDAIGLRRWTNEAMLLLVHHNGDSVAPARRRPSAVSLTQREQQVAHLIRRGSSNREVARTLQISEHTVERHVSSILSRLGLRSRWQIVDVRKTGDEG